MCERRAVLEETTIKSVHEGPDGLAHGLIGSVVHDIVQRAAQSKSWSEEALTKHAIASVSSRRTAVVAAGLYEESVLKVRDNLDVE